jgi:hypothetical protein
MKGPYAFTVKPHWGLLIRSGFKTVENRNFRVPPGFYLVHCANRVTLAQWSVAKDWVIDRIGPQVPFPSFSDCLAWRGCVCCGVRVASALTQSADPWFMPDRVAWELEGVVPYPAGIRARGGLGVWPVDSDVVRRLKRARRAGGEP